MKLLAHYTIFGNEILNLHTFDIENGTITHHKVVEETAHTEFIQGILIIAGNISPDNISELNRIISNNKNLNLRLISEKIREFLWENNLIYAPKGKFSLLISTYPDYILSKL